MSADTVPASAPRTWRWHVGRALAPEPAPVLIRVGVALVIDIAVVSVVVRAVLVAVGHPSQGLTHAVLPAVFAGMFAFLGSLGGSTKSGVLRAAVMSMVSFPVTLLAIGVHSVPIAAGVALALAAVTAGFLAWHGEPWATLGNLGLYQFFVPLAFGAGTDVPFRYLLISFGTMAVLTVALRAVVAVVPHRQAPGRVRSTDQASAAREHQHNTFTLVAQPHLRTLRRTTTRSAIGLGIGALVATATGDHNTVWILMTLIALVPPALPLTINRVLQRLVGTFAAMVVLTVVDVLVPPGPMRLAILALGLVVMIAFIKRSYAISVLGVSVVAVLGYAQVSAPLSEALVWRGIDTLVGAAIAIVLTLLIPVGDSPHPVWSTTDDTTGSAAGTARRREG